jgi:hypothetical protein
MEIVLAVLLLFGGFTLGSITADKGDDDVQSTLALPNGDGVPDSNQVTQALRQSDPTRCHSDRAVSYQDLTVPYHGKIDQPASQAGDCEGECPNE